MKSKLRSLVFKLLLLGSFLSLASRAVAGPRSWPPTVVPPDSPDTLSQPVETETAQ